jgi:microcystin-dependent protein
LFTAIGTTYGGSSASSFILPDLRGRAPFGKDNMGGTAANRVTSVESGMTGTALGTNGGAQSHLLTAAQSGLRAHGHTADVRNDWVGAGNASIQGSAGAATWGSVGNVVGVGNSNATSTHTNMPPTIITNYLIKL